MEEENSILKKIQLPGKRVRIPSRGYFYTDGEIDENVKDGEVEVFSMTTIDEITLRSPEFLFSGEAIDRVFKRCIPEIKKPLKLSSQDVDFLLACLRVVSYGGIYEINTRCPVCEEKQKKANQEKLDAFIEEVRVKAEEQEITLDAALTDNAVNKRMKTISSRKSEEYTYHIDLSGVVQNNTKEITEDDLGKYHFTLSNGNEIQLNPFRMDTAVMAYRYQSEDMDKNLDLVEEYISFLLASNIQSIDGIRDPEAIADWCTRLPIKLKEELQEKTEQLPEWGTNFDYIITCKNEDCNHERNINTLLNPITFFMKPSELAALNS